ncbi:aminotransferase class V-fold PLP-dependent enzyme [Flammeovirgaceae bacterium SG7u.111]|nr:aminotransferase class V-fold PLP-dependent enzyme [Flammeovirgaceae bacterium SG7u.132]WPO32996.1 aminotransferase class V-fold PLP-dependent enzyme [Flammeovirgaceae bacterium SG7u.111]
MNHKRRSFLKKISASSLGAFIFNPTSTFSNPPKDQPLYIDKGELDWKSIRKTFPLNTEKVFMNNGTMGPSPTRVLDAVKKRMDAVNETASYSKKHNTRQKLADFFGVKPSELALTHNTSEGINIVASGLPLSKDDEIILCSHEHVGNALPWLNRAKKDGLVVKSFEPGDSVAENLELINALITKRTKVIALPHVTCTTGLVFPIKEIVELAKPKGIYTAIDGAQAPGWKVINLEELGCDFYAGCGHKWMLAPKGTGFLYVKESKLDELEPSWVGGYSDAGWTLQPAKIKGWNPTAHRYDFATQNDALLVGFDEAITFLDELGIESIELRTRALAENLYEQLQSLGEKVKLLSPSEEASRSTLIGFRVNNGMNYKDLWSELNKQKYRVRMVPEAGLNSLRVSTHIYNSPEEIDGFINTLKNYL